MKLLNISNEVAVSGRTVDISDDIILEVKTKLMDKDGGIVCDSLVLLGDIVSDKVNEQLRKLDGTEAVEIEVMYSVQSILSAIEKIVERETRKLISYNVVRHMSNVLCGENNCLNNQGKVASSFERVSSSSESDNVLEFRSDCFEQMKKDLMKNNQSMEIAQPFVEFSEEKLRNINKNGRSSFPTLRDSDL